MRIAWLPAIVLLAWPCPQSSHPPRTGTVTVRVRLVYLKNGKPAGGQEITLFLGNPQKMSPAEWRSGASTPSATTSSQGVAVFRIPKPLPKEVGVGTENGRITGCGAGPFLHPLDAVLKHGVTIGVDKEFGPACGGEKALRKLKGIHPEPGEIVIFVRKVGVWERLWEY